MDINRIKELAGIPVTEEPTREITSPEDVDAMVAEVIVDLKGIQEKIQELGDLIGFDRDEVYIINKWLSDLATELESI